MGRTLIVEWDDAFWNIGMIMRKRRHPHGATQQHVERIGAMSGVIFRIKPDAVD